MSAPAARTWFKHQTYRRVPLRYANECDHCGGTATVRVEVYDHLGRQVSYANLCEG